MPASENPVEGKATSEPSCWELPFIFKVSWAERRQLDQSCSWSRTLEDKNQEEDLFNIQTEVST